MNFFRTILDRVFGVKKKELPDHLVRGAFGEEEARSYLSKLGLRFITSNYRGRRGEIDLVFEDQGCIAFVEVKTRTSEEWTRPATAVNARKKRLLSLTALEYVKSLKNPNVRFRFDIVEVLLHLDGEGVKEIRHLPNTFELTKPYRHG